MTSCHGTTHMGIADSPSLADMPAEMIDLIQEHLPRVKDLVSCQMALGADTTHVIARRASTRPTAFLEAGAPMHVVRVMLRGALDADTQATPSSPSSSVPISWLDAAVRGNRSDVLAHIHSLANVDHAHDIAPDSWATVGRTRWRRLYGEARKLLMEASSCGRLQSLVWLLDFYAASRFAAPRPLFNQALMSALCASASGTGRDANKLLAALHDRMPQRPCSCPPSVAFACLVADRPDLVDWMTANECAAPTHIMKRDYRRHLLDYLILHRSVRSLAWVAARSSERSVIDHMLNNPRQPVTHEWCVEVALLIMGMRAKQTLALMAAGEVLRMAKEAPRQCLAAVTAWGTKKFDRVRHASAHDPRSALAVAIILIAALVVTVYCRVIASG
nr:hypothetical protein [Pandoravirus aubagnensis]